MGSLRDRVKALEARAQSNAIALLDEEAIRHLARWPDLILEHYANGRLDELTSELPALRRLLTCLEQDGNAIHFRGHWHPLYRVADSITTERAMTRLEDQDNDFAAAALAFLSTTENTP